MITEAGLDSTVTDTKDRLASCQQKKGNPFTNEGLGMNHQAGEVLNPLLDKILMKFFF